MYSIVFTDAKVSPELNETLINASADRTGVIVTMAIWSSYDISFTIIHKKGTKISKQTKQVHADTEIYISRRIQTKPNLANYGHILRPQAVSQINIICLLLKNT